MEIDDQRAMAALLATAREHLNARVRPELAGDARVEAAMVANALGLVARGLAQPGTAWTTQPRPPATGGVGERARALRAHVGARLAVTNPAYVAEVADAPP